MKRSIALALILTLIFALTGCSGESKSKDKGKANVPANMEGVYVYEKFEGELPYIITFDNYTLNQDGTYKEVFQWVSKSLPQTTDAEDEGTWTVEGSNLILTNKGGYKTTLKINGYSLSKVVPLGFNADESATVYYKKE